MSPPIGLVLAGGAGRRIGRSKGALRVGSRPLALRAAEVLAPLCAGVLVSVRPGGSNPAPGYPAVEDSAPPGRGPLAGIAAALAATSEADLLVLACDYPRVEASLLGRLVERAGPADVTLVRDSAGRDHPLVALWRRRVRAAVTEALGRRDHRVGGLLERCSVLRLGRADFPGIDLGRALLNVNRPADLDRLGDGG